MKSEARRSRPSIRNSRNSIRWFEYHKKVISSKKSTIDEMMGNQKQLEHKAKLADEQASPGADQDEISRLEAMKIEAAMNLDAFQKRQEAKRLYDNIIELDAICKILSPTGARHQLMAQEMERVRKAIAICNKYTNWEQLVINDDYAISSYSKKAQELIPIPALIGKRKDESAIYAPVRLRRHFQIAGPDLRRSRPAKRRILGWPHRHLERNPSNPALHAHFDLRHELARSPRGRSIH